MVNSKTRKEPGVGGAPASGLSAAPCCDWTGSDASSVCRSRRPWGIAALRSKSPPPYFDGGWSLEREGRARWMAPNPAAVSGSHPQTQTLATQGMQQAVRVRFLLRTGGDRLLGIYQRRRRK